MSKRLASLVVVVAALLAGCNTMHGLGQDIERGGETLQGASKNVQEKM